MLQKPLILVIICSIVMKHLKVEQFYVFVLCLLFVNFISSLFSFGGESFLNFTANSKSFSNVSLGIIFLLLFWCCGIILGCCIYDPFANSMMHSIVTTPVSIDGIFISTLFPLMCTYFSIAANKQSIVLIVCFIKAVAYGFSCKLVYSCFLSAGWVVFFLLLSSDSFILFMLLSLWIKQGYATKQTCIRYICFAAFLSITSCFFNLFVVTPFLNSLF